MQPGNKIGKYEVLEKIGQGSFGVVYKGRDPFIKRIVAIKVCSADDEDLRKRFFREAQIVGTLQHRNLVTVYDFGIQDEAPFMVQEYLDGEDLSDIIQRKDDLPLSQRLLYLIQVAAGLAFAHAEDVIHRDIKPGNIRVLPEDRVKIMDFGIAKLTSSKTRLTQAGTTIGTAGYLSPEQLQATELDLRTDIFSFGVLAYEFLSYERPFRGNTFSKVAYQILYTPPMPLSASWQGCPVELERIVSRCLEKRREDRYADCGEIIADLEMLLEMDKDGITERIGSKHDPPAEKPTRDQAPAPAPKEPSPEATVAMRIPIIPPSPPEDRSSQPASAAAQAPPTKKEKPKVSQTVVLQTQEASSPATPRELTEDETPTPETESSQVLSSIDEVVPALPPTSQPPTNPEPESPQTLEKAEPAIEPFTDRKTEKSPVAVDRPTPKRAPIEAAKHSEKHPVAKTTPGSEPPTGRSPWTRAREQIGELPPSLRRIAFAGGAALLLVMLVVALWPTGEDDTSLPTTSEVVNTEQAIVEETPVVSGEEIGTVRVDSTPWARVIAIESPMGDSWTIPPGITTPTRIELPIGTWIVTLEPASELGLAEPLLLDQLEETNEVPETDEFQSSENLDTVENESEAAEPSLGRTCQVTVFAGQAVDCRVSLGAPDALDYFLEAGWWN